MPHENTPEARKSHGDKLSAMTGHRGEYPPDRAARITGLNVNASAQGDGAKAPEEVWVGAPARQVSNYGNVKGK